MKNQSVNEKSTRLVGPENQNADCENCGHLGLEPFINNAAQQLWLCPQCDLYQKGNEPDGTLYENFYHSGYERRRRNKTITALVRLGAVTRYVDAKRPRMLDIGCSIGATVSAAEQMGWEASGVDISQAAIEFCRSKGHDCHQIDGTELPFADNTFDVVSSWHVIEHVSDVSATLREWNRVVKPGGILVLETPDSQCLKARRLGPKYAKFWPVGHLYTFNRSNMCSLLETSGFEILPSRTIGKFNALSLPMTAYSLAYRSWRKMFRTLSLCKSIEVCCRKPLADVRAEPLSRAA